MYTYDTRGPLPLLILFCYLTKLHCVLCFRFVLGKVVNKTNFCLHQAQLSLHFSKLAMNNSENTVCQMMKPLQKKQGSMGPEASAELRLPS